MAITSGFFDSLDGDRLYNAKQFGSIFEGVVSDGVYQHVGDRFMVTAGVLTTVNIGTGRAWLRETWLVNDAIMPLTLDDASSILNRIDLIIIEVNKTLAVRSNTIRVLTGVAATTPVAPTLINNASVQQYIIAEVTRPKATTEITQAHITQKVGTGTLPYVTGVLETMSIDDQVAQWETQWAEWFSNQTEDTEHAMSDWTSSNQAMFESWFSQLSILLSDDVAANLTNLIVRQANIIETLARERVIYGDLTDIDGNAIQDSSEAPIVARVAFAVAEATSFRKVTELV